VASELLREMPTRSADEATSVLQAFVARRQLLRQSADLHRPARDRLALLARTRSAIPDFLAKTACCFTWLRPRTRRTSTNAEQFASVKPTRRSSPVPRWAAQPDRPPAGGDDRSAAAIEAEGVRSGRRRRRTGRGSRPPSTARPRACRPSARAHGAGGQAGTSMRIENTSASRWDHRQRNGDAPCAGEQFGRACRSRRRSPAWHSTPLSDPQSRPRRDRRRQCRAESRTGGEYRRLESRTVRSSRAPVSATPRP